jgi:hypothetical protein
VQRRTVGPLIALFTLVVAAVVMLGLTTLATLGGRGAAARAAEPSPSAGYPAPASGTLIKRAGSQEISVYAGGARLVFRSWSDLVAGYGQTPVIVTVPDAFYEGLPTQVASGTLIRSAENPAVAVVRDGRREVFRTWDSLVAVYGPVPPLVYVPDYYFDRLPVAGS